MIATLSGDVGSISSHSITVSVHGVGFRVYLPERTVQTVSVGEEIFLHTTLVVREDDLSLYGFTLAEERDTFDLLCGVNGVGPKSALGVLSALSVDDIAHAVTNDDDATFRQVSGIGPKTAKLITLSLQGKLQPSGPMSATGWVGDKPIAPSDETAIVQALVSLGWSERVAKKGVQDVLAELTDGDDLSVPALVRRALAVLGPQTSRELPR